MNLASQIRHFLTFLAGIGTILVGWHLIDPEQVAAVNAAGAALIDPLLIIAGAIAACVARLVLAWITNLFRNGSGELESKGGTPPGGAALLFAVLGTAAVLGGLPSCSPGQLANVPIRIGIRGPDAAVSYSSKSGLAVDAVIRGEK
jgi:hypothetical protein